MILSGLELEGAKSVLRERHYLRTLPRGETHYFSHGAAIVAYSVPTNPRMALHIFGQGNQHLTVWELARLWAPDGHGPNLLTAAISRTLSGLRQVVQPLDAVVAYCDPYWGHTGGVYHAASWILDAQVKARPAFVHINDRARPPQLVQRKQFPVDWDDLTIWKAGYNKINVPGKMRWVRLVTKRAKLAYGRRD